MSGNKKKVVFIGGHHTSALTVIKSLLSSRKDVEVHFIGHKFSAYKDKNFSAEYREITAQGIPFYNLYAGKVYLIFNIARLVRVPFGFLQALYFLLKIKPSLVVSFGGYLSAPVVFWAWVMRISVITHEQTFQGGWANIFVSKFAKVILLTWESSRKFFPKEKTKVIGLPLTTDFERKDITKGIFTNKLPLVFITGGKQGSHIINETVASILDELTDFCNVLIQCGDNSYFKDFDTLNALTKSLSKRNGKVVVEKFLSREEQLTAIEKADLLIGRAGAHFVYEVCFYKKPVILIPLPKTSHNEQYNNAVFVEKIGLAKIIEQNFLTGEALLREMKIMLSNLGEYHLTKEVALPKDAKEKFVEEINKLL
ncbi:hypothetical protein COT69_01570 [candidate division WWE3 bacterium CG09_land_8_20_14_0_10_39_24]|uniref:UDP-N-acetylglucosamine--N-acetylmuramyl-(pentapeptide) pyrophosphoryl-undecaprenol N-acetylglucosamine transferase n=2 Tax=Katanobacteria TaxID=422282 RepID=A0A2G9XCT7_UNCKA|nr:MAG: hypothetical protein AUJ94_00890 [bacterium CG2_30_40_12]OJI09010.1 MAG: hypothetical protein BK003_01550 [bacterium CG09_39_24]PIP04808.1 MAG: hypothetical protein COX53_00400 [candidate division WWE3 bacterium CG23_combo_of_CG06-09_8_20_14_all_40_14]PIS12904.1 MAG: hypothetical protein COT69_01570 [candidate division WWE3 bacterium CG09_land_8_20_14_0_10_39_24]PJE51730.1 MAG: hypothetical protein COV27_01545 [candidate division WWE3 bacterium CG10_big_fil_rev_8_21_14_0_10_39_14]